MIENLHLDVRPQHVVALLGPSGIGKTTLLRMLAGLERNFEGDVLLDGVPVTKPTRDIQLLFQDYRLLPWKTVYENVRFASRDITAAVDRADEWIKFVGLESRRNAWPKTLSGGEAGRVAFARAFVDQPKVLLLDEPFSGLDLATKYSLQDELLRALARQPASVVLVSHSIDDAVFLADTIHVVSSRPMTIEYSVTVEMPRPRRRGSDVLKDLAEELTERVVNSGRECRNVATSDTSPTAPPNPATLSLRGMGTNHRRIS